MSRRLQTVWITGVSSGVGEALANRFLEAGWMVFGSSRSAVPRRSAWIRHPNAEWLRCDVRSERSVATVWNRIHRRAQTIDMLINNAGVTSFKEMVKTSAKEFENIVGTNLIGLFHVSKAVLPSMRRRKKGYIVNILSYAAKTVYTKSGAYAASKAGAEMLMRVLREENREAGIRIVNVFPGAVDTPMWPISMRRAHGTSMMAASDVAATVYSLTNPETSSVPEEIVLRPEIGDLKI